MFIQLDIQLNHVIDLILNKILENDIRLVRRGQRVPGPSQKVSGFIQIQSRSNAKAHGRSLLRMIVDIVLDLRKDLLVHDGPLIDLRVRHSLVLDQEKQILGKGIG